MFFIDGFRSLYLLLWRVISEKPKRIRNRIFDIMFLSNPETLVLHMSSTPVLEISNNNRVFFFRECSRHTSKGKYVESFIDFYFDYLYDNKEFEIADKALICENLKIQNNLEKFLNIEKTVLKCGGVPPYYNFSDLINDFSLIGIKAHMDENSKKRLSTFFRYSISKLADYEINEFGFFNNKWNLWSSCRNFSYYEVLKLFGEENYSPNIGYCYLDLKGRKLFGVIMDEAKGIPAYLFIKNKNMNIVPDFQRKLLNFSVIDYICLIRDHNVHNYNIVTDENGNAIDVVSFDNNEAGSFSANESLYFSGYHGESPLIDKDGYINRPYFDAQFANKIINLEKKEVFCHLKNYLTHRQIYSLWQRVLLLRMAIKKTAEMRPGFLINKEHWSYETIDEECSGEYGKTYLYSLLK